jgi:hypothetical protein
LGQVGGEAGTGLGGPAAGAQRPHDPSRVKRFGDLGQPGVALLGAALVDGAPQPLGQLPGRLVARRRVRPGHERAEVSQRDLVHVSDRRLRPVAPLGGAQARRQPLGEGHQGVGPHLGLPGSAGSRVLLLQRLAHGGYAPAQHLLGDRLLLGREAGEQRIPVRPPGVEPLRPRLGRRRRGGRASGPLARRPRALWTVDARPTTDARGTSGARPFSPARRPPGSPIRIRMPVPLPFPVATGSPFRVSVGAPESALAVAVGAAVGAGRSSARRPAAVAPCRPGPLHGDVGPLPSRWPQHLEPPDLGALGLGREDRSDGHAVDVDVDIRPHHLAHLRPVVQERAVERALRLARAGGSPRPRPVRARARQLDVDAGHPTPR